jgi:hypothetical protein
MEPNTWQSDGSRWGLYGGCLGNTWKFSWRGLSTVWAAVCTDGHCRATLRHISTTVLCVWFEQLVSSGPEAFHYIGHCLLLCASLDSVPKLALVYHRNYQHQFARRLLSFELFWQGMSDFSNPYSGLCFLERNSGYGLFPSDNSYYKKSLFYRSSSIHPGNCQTFMLVLSCDLFRNPSCTNFMKPKSVLGDSMSRTMIDVHMMLHFIDSLSSIIQNYGTDPLSVILSSGCGRAFWWWVLLLFCFVVVVLVVVVSHRQKYPCIWNSIVKLIWDSIKTTRNYKPLLTASAAE